MGKTPFDGVSQLIAFLAGSLAVIIGLTTLVGWHTQTLWLVQLAPTLTPMYYNVALSLVASGIGLLALTRGRTRLAATCGMLVAAIGSLTLLESLFGVSLGIDQLFMEASLTGHASHPGRMSPNSALCFALTGLTLLVMSRAARHDRILLLAGPSGAIVFAIGLIACIGYLIGLKTYSWGYSPAMSPQTALGCVALGGGIMMFAWQTGVTSPFVAQARFAVLVGTSVLTATLCLWQALLASQEAWLERTIELAKASVHNEIMTQMQSRTLPLLQIARQWERQGRPSREDWEAEAALYVSHYPGVQAFAWVDAAFRVQWLAPLDGGHGVVRGLDLGFEDRRRSTLEIARDSRQVTATGILDLEQGGRGFHVYVPILEGAHFDGFMAGIFRTEDLFDAILGPVAPHYAVAIFEGKEEIYSRFDPSREYEKQWGQETAVGLYGVTWRVRVWPTQALLAAELSPLPEVILAVGLLTGALLILALHLARIAQQRATQVDMGNQALRHEISEHRRTEALLAERMKQMQTVRAVTMEITRELDLTSLLSLMTRRAIDLVAAARSGVVYLWDDSAQALIPYAWYGRGEWMEQVRIRLGEGIVGTVAQRQEGLLVNDYLHSPYVQFRVSEHFGPTAVMAEPLLYRDRLVGVIVLDNHGATQPFAEEDRELLVLFAAQAAIAIENARLYKSMEGRITRVQTLTRLNQLVSSSLDTTKVLGEIARAAAMLMEAAEVSFWLVDETTRTLEVQAFSDESIGADFPSPVVSFEQGEVGWVALHRRSLNVPDVFADDRFMAVNWWRTHNLCSFLGIPILHEDTLLAVLALHGDQPFCFGPDDQSLLDSFVAQAAVAIRNARLFAEIRAQTVHLTQLNTELHSEISERQRAEEALRASEVRFRSVVEAATDAIILGDSQGRIITWNQGAQTIFGYTEAEVLGKPLTMLMPARYRGAHQRAVERLMNSGQGRVLGKPLEFHGLRQDGREFPLEISLATWQAGGSMVCSGIIRDITERKEAMEQLQRQQEALYQREKLAAMGSLLASVAHELNNPLSVVMMQADLLSLEVQDETVAERIKEISQSAERCVRIVHNFLGLARQNPPQRMSVALNTVVAEALALLAYALRIDDIAVEQRLAADLPPLWADPHQLHQVVVNLITNAHQALRESPPPRRLTLTTAYDPEQRLVTLEVADTGPGIAPELRERIFEPFFTTKAPGVGTGLGLSFCKGIIEGHGGSISVDSTPGQGALFRITLRVEAASPTVEPNPGPEALPATKSGTILVIDDEPGITGALAYLLRRDGHTVETALNGRLALTKLQERTYDLILCDLRMPELDGRGFYRELERHYPYLLRRVIFLTGDALSPEAREFLEQVGLWQLSKPFRAVEVRQAVQQALHAGSAEAGRA